MADIYGQLVKAQFEHSTSDLSNVSGLAYYKSNTGVLKYYDGVAAAWKTLVDTTTAIANPMSVTGDIIYSSDNLGTPDNLAAGVKGFVLQSTGVGAVPAYAPGQTDANRITAGYVILDNDGYRNIIATTAPSTFTYVSNTNVSSANDTITKTSHGLFTGTPIRVDTTIGGLTLNVIYYVISTIDGSSYATNCDANTFGVATTIANAIAGTKINLTSTGSSTVTVTPGIAVILPTASANTDRRITVSKTYAAASPPIALVPEVAGETIGGEVGITIQGLDEGVTIFGENSLWWFEGEYFQSLLTSLTFTFNASGGTGAGNVLMIRKGRVVTASFPAITGTTGATSDSFTSGTIPAWAGAATSYVIGGVRVKNNGSFDALGNIQISTTTYELTRTAITAFSTTSTCGFQNPYVLTYTVD